jgi:hypothetical protein
VFFLKSFFEKTISHDHTYKVLQNVESFGLEYERNQWVVSYYLDFRHRIKNKEDFSWIRFSFNERGDILEQTVERLGKTILPDEDFFTCAMSTDIIYERIHSAQLLLQTRHSLHQYETLPDVSFFNYDEKNKNVSLQFSFSPVSFDLFLSPGEGVKKVSAFYTDDQESFPFSGCHLFLPSSLYFNEQILIQLNDYIKQKIRLKYFF